MPARIEDSLRKSGSDESITGSEKFGDCVDGAADEESRLFVAALARGMRLLTAFWSGKPSMSMKDLAQATGLTKSAVQRFSHTLWRQGYLAKHPVTKEFSLAVRSLEIGMRYLQTNPLVAAANPYLHALTRNCEETCSLAERDDTDMVYIARFPAHKEMLVNMPIGMRIPMYCTAAGRAVMSHLPEAEVASIFERSSLESHTSTTITNVDALKRLVADARRDGFAWCNGEYYKGDITVSAPILGPGGEPWGAVNASAPTSRWTLSDAIQQFGPQVMEAARAIGSTAAARQSNRHLGSPA